jgi:hypothetical protein
MFVLHMGVVFSIIFCLLKQLSLFFLEQCVMYIFFGECCTICEKSHLKCWDVVVLGHGRK